MDFLTGSNDIGTLGLGLLIAGTASGLFAGMLGIGGGLILVPVLYHVLAATGVPEALRMHLAIGTSLAALLPMTLATLSGHLKAHAVDMALLKRWSVGLVLGSLQGALLAWIAPGTLLVLLFGGMAIAVAVLTMAQKDEWRIAPRLPHAIAGNVLPFVLSALANMMGIGGRSLFVPALTLCGMPRAKAVGTATGFAAIIVSLGAVASVIAGWNTPHLPAYSYGYINLLAFGITAPVMYAAALAGAHYADTIEAKRPRATFALFVIVVAAKMPWDALS